MSDKQEMPKVAQNDTVFGNAAKLREVLEKATRMLSAWCRELPFRAWDEIGETLDKCNAALAAPPRNCDVGAAQEQEVRFEAFCHAHRSRERCCEDCPIVADRASCELAWAQMPYNESEVAV